MSADLVCLLLVIGMAPPLTLFPFVYAWVARGIWWRVSAGRAIMISTTSLAALVDVTLAYAVWGDDYALRDVVRISVFSGVFLGAWLKFGSLISESRKGRREHRERGQLPLT